MAVPRIGRARGGLRPGHLALLVVFLALRTGLASDAGGGGGAGDGAKDLLGQHATEEKETPGLKVFQVNFHHVEIPFIIGLWIFVSSLAKVGKKTQYTSF